jgi:WD40 repeat protein
MTRCTLIAILVAGPAAAAPPITAAAFTPDGKQVLVGSQAGIEIRSWPGLAVTGRLETDLSHVHDLAFAPDGRTLLSAGGSPGASGVVEVWNWPDRKRTQRVEGHKDIVYHVAWSPDGRRWVTASGDNSCRVYSGGELVSRYDGHSRPVLSVTFLPDGKSVVSAGVDQSLQVWETDTGKHLRTLDNHVAAVTGLAVRPGTAADAPPAVVSIGDDRTVRLWQPTVGRLVRFSRLPVKPQAVAWSPGGDHLLVGGADGRIRILDPDTLEVTAEKPAVDGRIYSLIPVPKGRGLLAGGAGLVNLDY